MKIVEEYEHFIEGARLDWLHPSHGRWPDLVAAVHNPYQGAYLVAVWWDGKSYVAMVEGPEQQHTIIQSYRWVSSGKNGRSWWCRIDQGYEGEAVTSPDSYERIRQLAMASCQMFGHPS